MKLFITGGLGFIGRHLSDFLLNLGHRVTAVGTRPGQSLINHNNFKYIAADTTQKGAWLEDLNNVDAVVNLAGKSIAKRWSKSYKKRIYDSRIRTTRNLVDALPEKRRITLCSTSAVGYYGNRGDDILTESASYGDDFLARVSRDWEDEAFRAEEKGVRVITTRFGVVLGKNGGAMEKMLPAFRSFVGGPMGNGMQWFPWIHMDDLMSAIMFIIENQDIRGPVNFCAPNPVRNRDLAKTMGHVLNRPAFMPAPSFLIRLALGEFGTTMLSSQRAVPEKLLHFGFNFKYPELINAVRDIVNQ